MKILVSNDDGVYAPGIRALAEALEDLGSLQVVAPDRNRSAASNSLTLDRPLEVHTHDNGFISLNGTPTDCVHMGISGLFGEEPDIVVSGINAGANLGDDVLYSGTVAAAMEGRSLHLPSIALSLVGSEGEHYETAAAIARLLVLNIRKVNLGQRTVLNVNVPDLPLCDIKGIHVTRLGHRERAATPVESIDPRGRTRYWISGTGVAQDGEPGTDFHAVEHGYVSITPLQMDMSRYSDMDSLAGWLETMDEG